MIGIEAIVSAIPDPRVEAAPRHNAIAANLSEPDLSGCFVRISRRYPGQEASDLCLGAARRLLMSLDVDAACVECMAVVTQHPDGYGIPHAAALVQRKLAVPDSCATFDLGLGGSGYVYALSVLKAFMEANSLRRGLLFTADPTSRVLDEQDKSTALRFGDASTVTLLSDKPKWMIGRFDFGTQGVRGGAFEVRMELGGRLHYDEGSFQDVVLDRVPRSVANALARNGLQMAQIDKVVVQQSGRRLVESIGRVLDAVNKTSFHASEYGDLGSSSIPVILEQNLAGSDRRVLICGFGSGLSWATTILSRAG